MGFWERSSFGCKDRRLGRSSIRGGWEGTRRGWAVRVGIGPGCTGPSPVDPLTVWSRATSTA